VRSGNFKTPRPKMLKKEETATKPTVADFEEIKDDELPF
jgi:hypothetical protein